MRSKRLWSLATAFLAATAMAAQLSVPAAAVKVDADVANIVTNPVNVTVCWLQFKCGGGNTYSFTSSSCTGISNAPGESLENGGCSATSNGTFTNVTCGTGTIAGASATITETGGDGGSYSTSNMSITFVAGLGVLDTLNMNDPNDGEFNQAAAGIVQITPNSLQAPTGVKSVCTNGFTVSAVTWTKA